MIGPVPADALGTLLIEASRPQGVVQIGDQSLAGHRRRQELGQQGGDGGRVVERVGKAGGELVPDVAARVGRRELVEPLQARDRHAWLAGEPGRRVGDEASQRQFMGPALPRALREQRRQRQRRRHPHNAARAGGDGDRPLQPRQRRPSAGDDLIELIGAPATEAPQPEAWVQVRPLDDRGDRIGA